MTANNHLASCHRLCLTTAALFNTPHHLPHTGVAIPHLGSSTATETVTDQPVPSARALIRCTQQLYATWLRQPSPIVLIFAGSNDTTIHIAVLDINHRYQSTSTRCLSHYRPNLCCRPEPVIFPLSFPLKFELKPSCCWLPNRVIYCWSLLFTIVCFIYLFLRLPVVIVCAGFFVALLWLLLFIFAIVDRHTYWVWTKPTGIDSLLSDLGSFLCRPTSWSGGLETSVAQCNYSCIGIPFLLLKGTRLQVL